MVESTLLIIQFMAAVFVAQRGTQTCRLYTKYCNFRKVIFVITNWLWKTLQGYNFDKALISFRPMIWQFSDGFF